MAYPHRLICAVNRNIGQGKWQVPRVAVRNETKELQATSAQLRWECVPLIVDTARLGIKHMLMQKVDQKTDNWHQHLSPSTRDDDDDDDDIGSRPSPCMYGNARQVQHAGTRAPTCIADLNQLYSFHKCSNWKFLDGTIPTFHNDRECP